MLPLDQPCKPSPDVLVQVLDGEAVLLDLASEKYFGLNGVGTRVWELLPVAPTPAELVERLAREYDVERSTLQADVLALLSALQEAGLVRVG